MGRHRHAINVRTDGLAAVLGRLLRDARIRSAALVDVSSGMLLDAYTADPARADLELLGAGHAELVRVTLGVVPAPRGGVCRCEVVVDDGAGLHHVLRVVPEEDGGLLALSVVVVGPERLVGRVRRRLRGVSTAALTAGPSTARRPASPRWALGPSSSRSPVRTGPTDTAPSGFVLPAGAGTAMPVAMKPSPGRGAEALPQRSGSSGLGADARRPLSGRETEPDLATLLFGEAAPVNGSGLGAVGPGRVEVDPIDASSPDGEAANVSGAVRMHPVSRLVAASGVVTAAREGMPLGATKLEAPEPADSDARRDREAFAHRMPGRPKDSARAPADADRRPAPPSALPPGPRPG